MRARGVYNELQLREKGVAMETERVGIPMQPIPRQSRRARGLEASRERRLEHWWEKKKRQGKSPKASKMQTSNEEMFTERTTAPNPIRWQ